MCEITITIVRIMTFLPVSQAWPLRGNDWVADGQLHDGSLYTLYYGKMPGVICEFLAWQTPKNITHVVQIAGPWIGK